MSYAQMLVQDVSPLLESDRNTGRKNRRQKVINMSVSETIDVKNPFYVF